MLLLVGIGRDQSSALWRPVSDALAAAKRDTDVVGWFKQGSMMGVMLTETGASPSTARRAVEDRVRRELAKRLDPASIPQVSLNIHTHPDGNERADSLPTNLRSSQSSATALAKRALDITGSLTLLLVLAPALLVIAALVKLTSPGPIFFRQVRVGRGAKLFTMLKFRTMFANADHALHRDYVSWFIKSSGQGHGDNNKALFKLTHDPRITRIGRVLRKTSLDELPQFINVLRGEMSLVGPRPPLSYELEQYKSWHRRRVLDVKPGITGLWQVTGRSRTTFDEMVRLDLQYARTSSLWVDIKILLATPRAVISGRGAC